jgi:type IX secretion system PorP/SprF family membrane protein
MKINLSKLAVVGFFFLSFFSAKAQDIHFSHIHASPMHLNPAMTGVFNDGTTRFIANARSQWESVTNGYKTVAGSIDMKIFDTKTSVFSGGLQLFADKAGDLDFSTTQAALSFSVMKAFDRRASNFVSLGFQTSYTSNRFDQSKMFGFDNEPLIAYGLTDNIHYFDLSLGAGWFANFGKHNSMYIGAAVYHLNMPDVSFSSRLKDNEPTNFQDDEKALFQKIVFHGGGNFRVADNLAAMPSFIYLDQGPHKEISMGSFLKVATSRSKNRVDKAFYMGAWIRWYKDTSISGVDAIVASVRADFNQTYLTFSFDINLSTLTRASYGAGGPELSVIQIIDYPRWRKKVFSVECPLF